MMSPGLAIEGWLLDLPPIRTFFTLKMAPEKTVKANL